MVERQIVIGGAAIAALGGLALLGYKIRTSEPRSGDDPETTHKLERRDLLEGGEPRNLLERIIKVGNRPEAYAALITGTFGMGVLLVLLGFENVAGAFLFGVLLFAIQAFLRFGWPYVEAFLKTAEPNRTDPDSLRFDGFSTDAKVFLTLFAALFLGVIVLALVESIG